MNIRGKIKSQEEFNFIQNVIRMSGRSEKEFVRAATLTYCDYLLKRADELRREAAQKKQKEDALMAMQGFTDEADEGIEDEPGSSAPDGNIEVQRVDEVADTNALANT